MVIKYLLEWNEEQQTIKVVHVLFSNYSQVFGPPRPLNLLKRAKNKAIALFKTTFKADFKVLDF